MALGNRTRRSKQVDGRRCSKCKKVAKDIVDGEYLCRVHSPMRVGFLTSIAKNKEQGLKVNKLGKNTK